MPVQEALQRLRVAGFSIEEGDPIFGEFYTATKGQATYVIADEAGATNGLRIGPAPFCD